MNFNYFLIDVDVEVVVDNYQPARPASHCSNPDDPRYSDPGDGPEFEYKVILGTSKKTIDITAYLPESVLKEIEEEIMEKGEEDARSDYEDMMSERAEERYNAKRGMEK